VKLHIGDRTWVRWEVGGRRWEVMAVVRDEREKGRRGEGENRGEAVG